MIIVNRNDVGCSTHGELRQGDRINIRYDYYMVVAVDGDELCLVMDKDAKKDVVKSRMFDLLDEIRALLEDGS